MEWSLRHFSKSLRDMMIKHQSKTKDMSFHGGYELVLLWLVDVVWKSFLHVFHN